MSTKLNRKASQEPEFWCFPCSTSNPQELNPKAQTTSSKSLNLFPLTNLRLLAISNPPNKSITTGNKNVAQSGSKNHELAQINLTPTEQSQPATNNMLIPKLTPTNYSQPSSQYSQIIPKLIINNFINLEHLLSSNLNFYASSKSPSA